ncbi:hypothetical protein Bca52824_047245 [Brassica carinata]|uniref:Uncharacterized protein n=1 Tax=Brassica carinata TaxID=52824 RepID=A0A8X7URY1_BRACI|nr:hypothetical protein Bca52824_047245 [Brassica carinata]
MENIEEASNNLGVKSSDQVADTENHSDPNQEEDPSLDNSSQMLVLQTPPKPFNMHTREVDDSDDFVGQVPQCVSSEPTHDTSDGEDEDDDFVEPVPRLNLLAKAGLKEEIRDGLETEEFATLEALFEEAEEVEEGLKETPPSSPRKRRRTSPDHRSSKRARKAERKGDPEDEGYGYPGEEETGLRDDEEGDYWEWMQMDTDVDDDASD